MGCPNWLMGKENTSHKDTIMQAYDASVPVLIHFLDSLSAILKKGEAHCAAKKIDPAVMLGPGSLPTCSR